MFGLKKRNWYIPKGYNITAFDQEMLKRQAEGEIVPPRRLILNSSQIQGIKESGKINTGVLDIVEEKICAGMSTADIDQIVYDYTIAHDAIPADLNYEGYPKSVCTSINEVVCHGIPSEDDILEEGDIINVDVSTIKNGYYSDASRMFIIGKTTPEKERLVRVTKECLDKGIEAAIAWNHIGDIGKAISKHAHTNGYTVVEEFCGHGVGLKFHDLPEICHNDTGTQGMLIVPGMVFTIEPMINMGKRDIFIDSDDNWTVITEDYQPSAQWEHTLLVTENGIEILTH